MTENTEAKPDRKLNPKEQAEKDLKDSHAKARKETVVEHKELQAHQDKVEEQGHWGVRAPRHPDEAYSLQTGPDAPTGENGPE